MPDTFCCRSTLLKISRNTLTGSRTCMKSARVAAAERRKRAALRWLSLGVVSLLAVIAVIGFLLFRHGPPHVAVELLVPEKSIAVLPFENRSRDPDNAYFADGIQDEILTRLSKIADLKVISR